MTTVADFIEEHGRVPKLGDSTPPWRFRGWFLHYVQEIQRLIPDVADRWGYLAETVEAGRYLDAPIPRIKFCGEGDRILAEGDKNIQATINCFAQGSWEGLHRFVEWLGFALGVSKDYPAGVPDSDAEKAYQTFDAGLWLLHPHDYLGRHIAMTRGNRGWNPNAFYPTPHCVVDTMVKMQFADETRDLRGLSVCDPCVGTGRMLLHASNYSMNLHGMDIDPLMVAITKINGAVYAPWLVCPPRFRC